MGEGLAGLLSQTMYGSWSWKTVSRGSQVPSSKTFILEKSTGGVMFQSSVLGKGR